MIITTRTFTRPSPQVPWHFEKVNNSVLFSVRMSEDFIDTNKILHRYSTLSDDELALEVVICWNSKESMEEHFSDALNMKYFAERDEYNKSVSISMSDLKIQVI